MSDDILWLDDAASIAEFCDAIEAGAVVAVDTESDHFFAYHPYVALIQVATPEKAALIDPLAVTTADLEPFLELMEDARVTKILHSCRNDIRELDRDFGVEVANIFDTQIAARFAGITRFSLQNLLSSLLDIRVSKKYQRFDWARRPIPQDAQRYAAGDVIHLFALKEELEKRLEARGWREAFEQQCAKAVELSSYEESPFDPEGWRRLKNTDDLDGRGRAALAALYVYRHELCDRLDRAALHVMTNRTLIELARNRPSSRAQLERIKEIKPKIVAHEADAILDVIRASNDAPIPPEELRSTRTRTSRQERDRQSALSQLRKELGAEVDLPLHLVLERSTLDALASDPPSSAVELEKVPGLLPWQRERFGTRILETLRQHR